MIPRRALLAAAVALILAPAARQPSRAAELPPELSNSAFWQLSQESSEQSGNFHSDNFVSNEGRFQWVIPDLVRRTKPGGLYLGVGPEQNFSYIAAVRPRMAIIVDIRRGNLQEHLLYKALFELSADRAEFLSRLFSRARPAGLDEASTPEELFSALDAVAPSEALYRANLTAVEDRISKTRGIRLDVADREGIDFIYRTAFFTDGPGLGYRLTGSGRNLSHPTYAALMTTDDGAGKQWSYLATEENYQFVRGLELQNLLVPIVGDFGGSKALRAVARFAHESRTTVSAFYLSNVEQYLRQDGKTAAFCANVAALPLDESSTFIRSSAGRSLGPGLPVSLPPMTGGLGLFYLALGSMKAETNGCKAQALARAW